MTFDQMAIVAIIALATIIIVGIIVSSYSSYKKTRKIKKPKKNNAYYFNEFPEPPIEELDNNYTPFNKNNDLDSTNKAPINDQKLIEKYKDCFKNYIIPLGLKCFKELKSVDQRMIEIMFRCYNNVVNPQNKVKCKKSEIAVANCVRSIAYNSYMNCYQCASTYKDDFNSIANNSTIDDSNPYYKCIVNINQELSDQCKPSEMMTCIEKCEESFDKCSSSGNKFIFCCFKSMFDALKKTINCIDFETGTTNTVPSI